MESRILRFTIRFYDSIHETLPTIQGRIPILITLVVVGFIVVVGMDLENTNLLFHSLYSALYSTKCNVPRDRFFFFSHFKLSYFIRKKK